MTRCESYPLCSGTIYFPTAPFPVLLIFSDSLEQLLQNTDVKFTDFLHYLNMVNEL